MCLEYFRTKSADRKKKMKNKPSSHRCRRAQSKYGKSQALVYAERCLMCYLCACTRLAPELFDLIYFNCWAHKADSVAWNTKNIPDVAVQLYKKQQFFSTFFSVSILSCIRTKQNLRTCIRLRIEHGGKQERQRFDKLNIIEPFQILLQQPGSLSRDD